MRAPLVAVLVLFVMVPAPALALAPAAEAPAADNACIGLDELRCVASLFYCSYAALADASRLGDCIDRVEGPGADEVCRVGIDPESITRCSLRVIVCFAASLSDGYCTA